jgi:hypothetical protein
MTVIGTKCPASVKLTNGNLARYLFPSDTVRHFQTRRKHASYARPGTQGVSIDGVIGARSPASALKIHDGRSCCLAAGYN